MSPQAQRRERLLRALRTHPAVAEVSVYPHPRGATISVDGAHEDYVVELRPHGRSATCRRWLHPGLLDDRGGRWAVVRRIPRPTGRGWPEEWARLIGAWLAGDVVGSRP